MEKAPQQPPSYTPYRHRKTLTPHKRAVSVVKFSNDGELLASATLDKTLAIYSGETLTQKSLLVGHTDGISDVAWSSDSHYIVSASNDKTLRIWDARDCTLVKTLQGHTGAVFCVDFNTMSNLIVSGAFDESVGVWDGKNVRVLEGHSMPVTSVSFNPDGSLIVSGSHDGSCKIRVVPDVSPLKPLKWLPPADEMLCRVGLIPALDKGAYGLKFSPKDLSRIGFREGGRRLTNTPTMDFDLDDMPMPQFDPGFVDKGKGKSKGEDCSSSKSRPRAAAADAPDVDPAPLTGIRFSSPVVGDVPPFFQAVDSDTSEEVLLAGQPLKRRKTTAERPATSRRGRGGQTAEVLTVATGGSVPQPSGVSAPNASPSKSSPLPSPGELSAECREISRQLLDVCRSQERFAARLDELDCADRSTSVFLSKICSNCQKLKSSVDVEAARTAKLQSDLKAALDALGQAKVYSRGQDEKLLEIGQSLAESTRRVTELEAAAAISSEKLASLTQELDEKAKALLAVEEKEAAWLEKEACWLAEKESLVVKMWEVRLESFTKGYARGDRGMKELIRDVDPDFNFQKMLELGQQRQAEKAKRHPFAASSNK